MVSLQYKGIFDLATSNDPDFPPISDGPSAYQRRVRNPTRSGRPIIPRLLEEGPRFFFRENLRLIVLLSNDECNKTYLAC